MYYVWERNDGAIAASKYRLPKDYKTLAGDTVSFKLILQLTEWDQDKVQKSVTDWIAAK